MEVNYAVPGDVHSALIAAGKIPHPYKGRNELEVRWVANQQWTATRSFNASKTEGGKYYLDIDYLDTVAEVFVNDQSVLKAENCFRRYRPDVTDALMDGDNSIRIVFASNTKSANTKQAEQPFPIPYSFSNNPIPNGNMLRKPACHFGWDWNLAIVPFGIYGRIQLRRMENFRIEHVVVHQQHGAPGDPLTVEIDVAIHGRGATDIAVTFAGDTKSRHIDHAFGEARQRFRFKVMEPKLWWPAGHGEQPLYDVVVSCDGQTDSRRVGLRKVELLTDKDEAGSRFAFRINGREIFCRGANWIPADALPTLATPDLTRKLLQAAIDANMNMLRVWGGGYYEKDFFYDLCDEMGLLVWQDFMFSCSLYPSTPEFLREVKMEVEYQVKRLQHHACLTLWCGDNELIGALTWFKESKDDRDRYLVNYDRLNRTIEETMRTADPRGLWWPSSPSPGILDFGDAWHDDSNGDMHFWSVWHEGRDFEHYRDVKPRFCSEFGFQSYPSMNAMKEFAGTEDHNISSAVMEHHQRNKGGNARIAETMFRNFRFPEGFGNFVYVSQIQQGLAMRTAVDYWRSLKPHCMGTLYWQLNDTWPVASWSGLDHGGSWKLMHHMAREFFAPVAVSLIPDSESGDYIFIGVNDTSLPVETELVLIEMTAAGQKVREQPRKIELPSDRAIEMGRLATDKIPQGNILFWTYGETRRHMSTVPYKHLHLLPPGLSIVATPVTDRLLISIRADNLALFVTLETSVPGIFTGNVFDLLPGETRSIAFLPDNPGDLATAKTDLVTRDLYSSSH